MNRSQRLTLQPLLNINPLYSQYLLYTVFMLPDNYKGDQLQCENHGKGKSVLYIAQSYQLSDWCVCTIKTENPADFPSLSHFTNNILILRLSSGQVHTVFYLHELCLMKVWWLFWTVRGIICFELCLWTLSNLKFVSHLNFFPFFSPDVQNSPSRHEQQVSYPCFLH